MFTAALFILAEITEVPPRSVHLWISEWINKKCGAHMCLCMYKSNLYIMEEYSVLKKNGILPVVTMEGPRCYYAKCNQSDRDK